MIAYRRYMTNEEAEKEAETILRSVDANENGEIEYSEFVQASINRKKLITDENLKIIFEQLD